MSHKPLFVLRRHPTVLIIAMLLLVLMAPSAGAQPVLTLSATNGRDPGSEATESALLAANRIAAPASPPAGNLDPSFDGDGIVATGISSSPGSSNEYAWAVAIQSDGKIVAAGYANNGSNDDFALARYNTNGSLDATFGSGGKITTPILSSHDIAQAVAIQSDGKIVAAGRAYNGSNDDFALARYNSDGSLDTSFDSDGKVTTAIGVLSDGAYAIAIQSDGKIVVAGYANNGSNDDFALARYNTNGSLDATFGSGGKVTTPILSSTDQAYAVASQSDGKIVVAGRAYNGSNDDFALARYNSNGSLDTSFDTDGKLSTVIGNGNDYVRAMRLQSDGKIVVAGYANTGTNDDFTLARYQVASTSSQTIAHNASSMLEGVTVTNHSGASCTLTITKYPVPPGGTPADSGEMPVHWRLTTDCTSYNFDLVFSYNDTEALFGNNVNEANLQAYRSTNGNDYSLVGGTVNTTANTVTVTGVTQLSWWALGSNAPLAVDIASFIAGPAGDGAVRLAWETVSEVDHLGFNLYRGPAPEGPWTRLNAGLIASPSPGATGGHSYEWLDTDVSAGQVAWYQLEALDMHGAAQIAGLVSVQAGPAAPRARLWLPLVVH